MKRLALVAIALATALATGGCLGTRSADETRAPLAAGVAGRYQGPSHLFLLELAADGAYECLVLNGLADFGCATMEGAGVSAGTWTREAEMRRFYPEREPADLVVSLAGASALCTEDGLIVMAEGVEYALRNEIAAP